MKGRKREVLELEREEDRVLSSGRKFLERGERRRRRRRRSHDRKVSFSIPKEGKGNSSSLKKSQTNWRSPRDCSSEE